MTDTDGTGVTAADTESRVRSGERDILKRILAAEPLTDTLDVLARLFEELYPGTLCSCLLLDNARLTVEHVSAPSLPETYRRAIDGLPIGPPGGRLRNRHKDSGRNRVVTWDQSSPYMDQRRKEMQWVPKIVAALEERRFEIAAQPIVHATDPGAQPERYEILLRMRHGDDLIAPGRFLPVADRYGLAPEVDQAVVKLTLD